MNEIGKKQKKTNHHGAVRKACAAALCAAMLLTLGGCGAKPGKEPAKVEGEDVIASGQAGSEDAGAADSGQEGAEGAGAADSGQAGTEGADAADSGQAGAEGAGAAASGQAGSGQAGGSTGGNSQPGETPSTGSMHISGDITDVGDGSFTVSIELDNTAEYGKYGEASSGETKNAEIISLIVHYTQDTQFVINSVSNDGASSSQAEGTAADLENGLMVILDGTRTGDDFKADKVAIFHFGK